MSQRPEHSGKFIVVVIVGSFAVAGAYALGRHDERTHYGQPTVAPVASR